ncbi:hypothetical protein E2C01_004093 [Portunus trituberculatus]|uniref:Uncharacterized protein n=1 Tax=Portunus trituberculatus TaxID=210409 RepID=A0A5B7CQM7_PORTR|nr:hypothetical protein [Portunus trituberculatus]
MNRWATPLPSRPRCTTTTTTTTTTTRGREAPRIYVRYKLLVGKARHHSAYLKEDSWLHSSAGAGRGEARRGEAKEERSAPAVASSRL